MRKTFILLITALLMASSAFGAITEATPRAEYTAAGGDTYQCADTGGSSQGWPIWVKTDLRVWLDGTLQVVDTDYTVTFTAGDDSDCSITFVSTPTSGLAVVMERASDQERASDFATSGPFSMASMNDQLDILTTLAQDNAARIDRTARLDPGEAVSSDFSRLPQPTANYVLGYAADGSYANLAYSFDGTWDGNNLKNYTELKAITGQAEDDQSFVAGRSAAGDGGGGVFVWDGSDLSIEVTADTAEGIYVAPGSDATGASGAWVRLYDGALSVKWFGAKIDDSTDDLTSWQAAIDFAETSGGKILFTGVSRISAEIVIDGHDVTIEGLGPHCVLKTTSSTANILVIGDGVSEVKNTTLTSFAFDSTVTKTAGYAIHSKFGVRMRLTDIRMSDAGTTKRLWDGIYFDKYDNCTMDKCFIGVLNDGIIARTGAELFIGSGTRIVGCGRYGVHLGGDAGGVKFGASDINSSGSYQVYISDTLDVGTPNGQVYFGPDCSIDNGDTWGILVAAAGVEHLDVDGSWIAGQGQSDDAAGGINIQGSQITDMHLSINKARIFSNYGTGIEINSGGITLTDSYMKSNGLGVAGGHGVSVITSNVNDVTISGNLFRNNGIVAKGYGVDILNAGADNILVNDNIFLLNAQGSINNAATPSTTVIAKDNIGYVTSNSGTATVLNTATTVVVTHGLASTPTQIDFTQLNSNQGTFPYVSTVGATTFTINLNAVASANRDFFWEAGF